MTPDTGDGLRFQPEAVAITQASISLDTDTLREEISTYVNSQFAERQRRRSERSALRALFRARRYAGLKLRHAAKLGRQP